MKFKGFAALFQALSTFFIVSGVAAPSFANVRSVYPDAFVCRQVDGVFATFAIKGEQEFTIIRWQETTWQNHTPEDRCQIVSERLTSAARDQSLRYLTNGWMNGQPVVCTTPTSGGECDRLIFTLLHREANLAEEILRDFQDIGSGRAAGRPLYRSWGTPQIVTEEEDQVFVNMESLFQDLFTGEAQDQ